MPKAGKRVRDEEDGYDSDGGFVSNDDAPKKKSKKSQTTPKDDKAKAGSEERFWELSSGRNPRRVTISSFKDVQLINIREFYEKNDEYLPGKKGISLTVEQYQTFLKAVPEINAALQGMGIDVLGEAKREGDAMEEGAKPRKRVHAKKEKANIEATSDEEE